MTSAIELKSDELRCEITSGLGGAIAGLWLGDTPVTADEPHAIHATHRLHGGVAGALDMGVCVLQAGQSMSAEMLMNVVRTA